MLTPLLSNDLLASQVIILFDIKIYVCSHDVCATDHYTNLKDDIDQVDKDFRQTYRVVGH